VYFSADFNDEFFLDPDETYDLTVTFAPEERGDFEGTLTIISDDPDEEEIIVSLSGIGLAPDITISPDALDFGNVLVNDREELGLTISNEGNGDLIVSDVSVEGNYFSTDFDDEIIMEPDDSYDLTITFSPEEEGEFEAVLTITSNDPDSMEFHVPLIGIGFVENHPPEVENSIDDKELDEDFDSFVIVDLDTVFADADGDELEFVAESNNENFTVSIENNSSLRLTAAENWWGEATVTITADDGFDDERDLGPVRALRSITSQANSLTASSFKASSLSPDRDESAETSFNVTVVSVNDEPEFTDNPENVEAAESDLIEFALVAEDVDFELDENEVLALSILDDDGISDRGARFVDNWDGTADFTWQTDYEDAGEYVPIFRVRDGAGETDQIVVNITVVNSNRPPEWVQEIEPIEFDEDDDQRMIADLNDYVSDPDGDQLRFDYIELEGLSVNITGEHELYLQPAENWNGVTEIVIAADDGNEGFVTDTISITVNSINDLPSEFELVSPADSATVRDYPDVEFTWQRSIDMVEDSSVTYNLLLHFNEENHWFRNIEVTSFLVSRGDFDLYLTTEVIWQVWANDGIDSLASVEQFYLTVVSLSVSDMVGLTPDKLSLGPVSPNPFNSSAVISYQLPQQAYVTMSIYDINGRQVAELINGNIAAGYHSAVWNGVTYPAGIYICRMETEGFVKSVRILLVK
jgi:hypothetical protein